MPQISLDGLSPAQVQVAGVLASGASISKAALLTQTGRTTIYTWLKTIPQFASLVKALALDSALQLRDKLHDMSMEALDTVGTTLSDPEASPSVRLRAALAILNRPDKGWALPHPVEIPAAEQNGTIRNTSEQKTETPPPQTPRNAVCPCGSGQKYKRCCGRASPPVLSTAA